MKKSAKLVFVALAAILLSSCACDKVRTHSGQEVKLPKCRQTIFYSGNSLKIADITIPFAADKASIKGIDWEKTSIQQAAPAIAAMEQTRLRLCEESIRDIQLLEYKDFVEKDKKRQVSQDKLDQLTMLVASDNVTAVDHWINAYLIQVPVAPAPPLGNSSKVLSVLGGNHIELKGGGAGKTDTTVRFEPRNIDVQPFQELLAK